DLRPVATFTDYFLIASGTNVRQVQAIADEITERLKREGTRAQRIEGAHEGAGLGDRFLRHIERTKLLLHLVDVSSVSGRDAVSDYEAINRELLAYDPQLAERPQIVVATKLDALDEPERLETLRRHAAEDGRDFYAISSVTNTGVRELVYAVSQSLDALKEFDAERAQEERQGVEETTEGVGASRTLD
ncbi:MAG: RsfS/YbeB/iojap family protein, partial [Acidobacteria bacterium]|nr:RsfS/YbeB/iojap family protein [Acidobacteriota bacterium]